MGNGVGSTILMMLTMVVVLYFLVVRPKQMQKEHQEAGRIQYSSSPDEEILASSKRYNVDWIFFIATILFLVCIYVSVTGIKIEKELYYPYHRTEPYVGLLVCSIIGGIISVLIFLWLSKVEITVTNKRVYGCAAFGKRVDLPIDSISAVGMSMFGGLAVGTSSGRIVFNLLKDRDAVHFAISELLIQRQSHEPSPTITQAIPLSDADEIKKYKELLDSGVITQEEFDAKKKQLLGL